MMLFPLSLYLLLAEISSSFDDPNSLTFSFPSLVQPWLIYLFFALFTICLVLFVVKKVITRCLPEREPRSRIQILEQKLLSPKTTLYLVKVDGHKVLFTESSLQIASLLEDKIVVEASPYSSDRKHHSARASDQIEKNLPLNPEQVGFSRL
ncbi:MAG: hypothetical protein AAGF04_03705 [Chlamydiota bacterium]